MELDLPEKSSYLHHVSVRKPKGIEGGPLYTQRFRKLHKCGTTRKLHNSVWSQADHTLGSTGRPFQCLRHIPHTFLAPNMPLPGRVNVPCPHSMAFPPIASTLPHATLAAHTSQGLFGRAGPKYSDQVGIINFKPREVK